MPATIPSLSGITVETDPAYTAGGASDVELAAAVATLNTSLALKQDSSTAATDAELASAVSTLSAAVALKQDASTAATDAELAAVLPWRLAVGAYETPDLNTGFTNVVAATAPSGSLRYNDAAQNDEVAFDLVLAAGTWDLVLWVAKYPSYGIFTVSIDGVTIGTLDSYAAAAEYVVPLTLAGIVVASTGKKRVKLKMATKNAAASAYYGVFNSLTLQRTA